MESAKKWLLVSLCLFSVINYPARSQTTGKFSNVFQKVKDSVVTIKVKTTNVVAGKPVTVEGGGSGVIISADGLVVTNKHVVSDKTRSFSIFLNDGRELAAAFIGMAPDTDLSILKLNPLPQGQGGLSPITLGDSDKITEGDWVLAIGSPFGLGGSLTHGIISAKERPIKLPGETGQYYLIQTDAPINPGNSGGALVNMAGELIGVPTMILTNTGASAGIGFAIPSNMIKKVIGDVANKRSAIGWLGVLVQDASELDPAVKKQLGLSADSKGVVVTSILPGGSAEKSGLKNYDLIIAVNGQEVSGVADFRWLERNLDPLSKASIQISRKGSTQTIEILVGVGGRVQAKNRPRLIGCVIPRACTAEFFILNLVPSRL